MAISKLRSTVNSIMGLDRCVFMTQYFNSGDPDIFIPVSNDADGTHYILYEDENGSVLASEIGTPREFKRFICKVYGLNSSLNYSNDYWGSLLREQHIKAREKALSIIKTRFSEDALR